MGRSARCQSYLSSIKCRSWAASPAVVGDNDTVTISGSNFPSGRARCRFGEQVIVESQAVWRGGLRCKVPPRHKNEDSKASRSVVEVAFEGSDFLKTRTSIAHVGGRPRHRSDALVQGAIKDLKTIYPSSGSLFWRHAGRCPRPAGLHVQRLRRLLRLRRRHWYHGSYE